MFDQLKNIKNLRDQAKQLQATLSEVVIEETEGNSIIKVNGNQKVLELKIDPELLNNKENLEKNLVTLYNKAKDKAQREAAMKMQAGGGLPDLPDLG